MKFALLLSLSFFLVSIAQAGDAGCGLGSVVISKNSKLLQLFAVTTNNTFFSQVFGITSGTSNCSSSGLVSNDKQIQYFVEVNQDDLAREMAQGEGEKLNTLATLHGCKSAGAQKSFAQYTQKSYARIFTAADITSTTVINNLEGELAHADAWANECEAIRVSGL